MSIESGQSSEEIGSERSKAESARTPENQEANKRIEQLQREVDTLKRGMGALAGNLKGIARMLFESGGKGLDEHGKRDRLLALEEASALIMDQLAHPTTNAERENELKEEKKKHGTQRSSF